MPKDQLCSKCSHLVRNSLPKQLQLCLIHTFLFRWWNWQNKFLQSCHASHNSAIHRVFMQACTCCVKYLVVLVTLISLPHFLHLRISAGTCSNSLTDQNHRNNVVAIFSAGAGCLGRVDPGFRHACLLKFRTMKGLTTALAPLQILTNTYLAACLHLTFRLLLIELFLLQVLAFLVLLLRFVFIFAFVFFLAILLFWSMTFLFFLPQWFRNLCQDGVRGPRNLGMSGPDIQEFFPSTNNVHWRSHCFKSNVKHIKILLGACTW